ncbi:MAG: carbon starvation CstA family protein [Bacillota bacterium]
MNSVWLLILGAVLFILAYLSYGAYLAAKWGVDPARKTPAQEIDDGVDYVPTNRYVLLGHHFASIVGGIFGSANQLLSALSLLALTAWLVRTGKNMVITFLPMLWMFAVTLSATLLLMKSFYYAGKK